MPKLICEKTVNGVTAVRNITTPVGNQGLYVASICDEGQPFYHWPTIPPGRVIGCDFTNAPLATKDPVQNNALIAGISVAPEDVLIYE